MKGLSRIDNNNNHGWFARIYHDEIASSKYYSDNVYGRANAEQLAIYWLDRMREKYPPPQSRNPAGRAKPMQLGSDFDGLTRTGHPHSTGIVGISDTFVKSRTGENMPVLSIYLGKIDGKVLCKKIYYGLPGQLNRSNALALAVGLIETSGRKEENNEASI